jgi:hypothetical protein
MSSEIIWSVAYDNFMMIFNSIALNVTQIKTFGILHNLSISNSTFQFIMFEII